MRVSETPAGLPAIVRAATDTPPSEHPPAPRAVPEPRPTSARAEPTRKLKLPPVEDSDTDAGPGTAEDTLVEATAEDVDTASDASASDASASDAGDHDGAIGQPPLEALPPLPPLARDVTTTLDLGPLRGEILLVQPDALEHQRAAHRRETATTVPIRVPRVRDSDEPIPTRTMARLLHEQGHHRRALAILQNLLAQRPGDRELQADLEAVGRSLGLAHTPAAPLNPGARAQPSPRAELVSMLLPGSRVLLAWGLSDESLASAKSLGARGTLVARVLVHAPGESGAVARSLTDKDVSAAGEWAIGPIASGSFVTAAVGFRDGEQFVSVAAAPVLDIA